LNQFEIDPEFNSVIGMGPVQGIYKQRGTSRFWLILLSAVCIPAGFFILYYGLVTFKISNPGSPILAFIFIALIVLTLGFLSAWRVIGKWNEVVVLYQNGFAYKTSAREMTSFKWNEIRSILIGITKVDVHGIPVGTAREYVIKSDTNKLAFDGSLDQVDDLLENIRKNVYPYIYARTKQEFDSGKTIRFGNFLINKSDGVRRNINKYKWSDVAQVRVMNGNVHFLPKKRGSVGIYDHVGKTPNLEVLLAISQELIKQNQNSK
jgi:hypothetical protein